MTLRGYLFCAVYVGAAKQCVLIPCFTWLFWVRGEGRWGKVEGSGG